MNAFHLCATLWLMSGQTHTPLMSLSNMYENPIFHPIVGSTSVCVTHNKCRVVLGADCFVKGSYAISGPEIQVSSSILQNLYELCTTFQLRRHCQWTFWAQRNNSWHFWCISDPFYRNALTKDVLSSMKYSRRCFEECSWCSLLNSNYRDCQDFFFLLKGAFGAWWSLKKFA